jgi:hypothetical protein
MAPDCCLQVVEKSIPFWRSVFGEGQLSNGGVQITLVKQRKPEVVVLWFAKTKEFSGYSDTERCD